MTLDEIRTWYKSPTRPKADPEIEAVLRALLYYASKEASRRAHCMTQWNNFCREVSRLNAKQGS